MVIAGSCQVLFPWPGHFTEGAQGFDHGEVDTCFTELVIWPASIGCFTTNWAMEATIAISPRVAHFEKCYWGSIMWVFSSFEHVMLDQRTWEFWVRAMMVKQWSSGWWPSLWMDGNLRGALWTWWWVHRCGVCCAGRLHGMMLARWWWNHRLSRWWNSDGFVWMVN